MEMDQRGLLVCRGCTGLVLRFAAAVWARSDGEDA